MKILVVTLIILFSSHLFSQDLFQKISAKSHPGEHLAISNSIEYNLSEWGIEFINIRSIEISGKQFRAKVKQKDGQCQLTGILFEELIYDDQINPDSEIMGYVVDEAQIDNIDCH